MTSWFLLSAAGWALFGAGSDLYDRRLPNTLNALGLLLALGCFAGSGVACNQASFGQCLVGGVVGLLALLPFWFFRLMGAGDVKFFAVMGTLGGVWILPPVFLIGSLIAAVLAFGIILARDGRLAGVVPLPVAQWLGEQGQRGLPFGAALAAGFVISLLTGLDHPARVARLLFG